MSIRIRKLYVDAETGRELEFLPAYGIPEYRFRVIIDRKPFGWLHAGFQPSAKSAEFFLKKHQEERRMDLDGQCPR